MKSITIRKSIIRLLVFIAFVTTILISSSTVNAANYYLRWEYIGEESEFTMELGQQLYIGDFVKVTYGKQYFTGTMVKATYASSNKKIATVNKSGLVVPKKVGECDIYFKFGAKTLTAHLNIVAGGSLGLDKEYNYAVTQLKSYAAKITVPAKITNANAYALYNNLREYRAGYNLYSCRYLTDDGVAYKKRRIYTKVGLKDVTSYLAVPAASRYLTLNAMVNNYRYLNDPLDSDTASKRLKIKKVTTGASDITVVLKKAPTTAQILALQMKNQQYNPYGTPATEAKICMSVYSSSAKGYLNGWATLKSGSNTFKITLASKTDLSQRPVSIVKGTKYEFRLAKGDFISVVAK